MIRVRNCPSPTGLLHIGTVRSALYNYLFAKSQGGTVVFRIEDTDKERSTKEYEEDIINGLVKLGIAGDEGVHIEGDKGYRQSERTEVYTDDLKRLLEEDKAYYCFCSKERLDEMRKEQREQKLPPRYDGCCSKIDPSEAKKRVEGGERAVIRLRVPENEDISFTDLIRGETKFDSKEFDDFVIARAIDDPLYHLTVVADDHDMEITHVIRGEDHISNTPKQILIYRAFGWDIPKFAHLPLILNEDKSKLSKRKNKVSVDDYLADGYLPEALLNFLALLGWHPGGGGAIGSEVVGSGVVGGGSTKEIFSMDELIQKFSLKRVHKGGAVFDIKKLDWINGQYLSKKIDSDPESIWKDLWIIHLQNWNEDQLAKKINLDRPYKQFKLEDKDFIFKILRDADFEGRFSKLSEIPEVLSLFFEDVADYPKDLIMREKFNITPEILKKVLEKARSVIEGLEWEKGDSSKNDELSQAMINIVGELGLKNGQVLWPLRVALSGLERSPNFSTLMVYLGKEEVLNRIDKALSKVV